MQLPQWHNKAKTEDGVPESPICDDPPQITVLTILEFGEFSRYIDLPSDAGDSLYTIVEFTITGDPDNEAIVPPFRVEERELLFLKTATGNYRR